MAGSSTVVALSGPRSAPKLRIGRAQVPIFVVPNRKARRYILRITREGAVRVTVPRGGRAADALEFVRRSSDWIVTRWMEHRARAARNEDWRPGDKVILRGEPRVLMVRRNRMRLQVYLGDEGFDIPALPELTDFRPVVETWMQVLAKAELVERTFRFAKRLGISISAVTVRGQRTRWGSCSSSGRISLNWRLVQTPDLVRDYIIVHELIHRRYMNHSDRYWKAVEQAFPRYEEAERWLKTHSRTLLG